MPRPCCLRHIGFQPPARLFQPADRPPCALEQVVLSLDEVEALRLADLEGFYQEQAAAQMKISRPTFSRIVATARRKVADALIHGRALCLEGGVVSMADAAEVPGIVGTGSPDPRDNEGAGPCRCRRRRDHVVGEAVGSGRCPRCRGSMSGSKRSGENRARNEKEKGEQSP
jgi:predicted DNA-binding protein (UPF0251 family)